MRLKAGSLRAPLLAVLLVVVAGVLTVVQLGILPAAADETPASARTTSVGPPSVAAQEGSVEEDRAALVAFYHATNGDRWRRAKSDGWLTDAPLDEWYGVDTDANGRVTVLDLTESGLRGYIPPELGNLSSLTALYLDYNGLEGSIPPELGNLSNLTILYLHDNRLSGTLSPSLGRLVNLTELDLVNNNFTGWIPSELGGLINMSVAWLAGNEWVGCIPDALRSVPVNDLHVVELDFCDPLPAVPSPVGGNHFLVKLKWEPSLNAGGHLVRVHNTLAPDVPIRKVFLSADANEATVALPGGETYEFEVCAYSGALSPQMDWSILDPPSCNWSGREIFSVGEQDIVTTLLITLRDDVEIVYLMDTSGSMSSGGKIVKLGQSLERIRDRGRIQDRDRGPGVRNARAALVDFDSSPRVVFNLTETGSGSWEEEWNDGIASLHAGGGTNMYSALQFASDMLPDEPVCPTPDSCRKREIVLMSDGLAQDGHLEDSTLAALKDKGIVVRTFAFGFGPDADKEALKRIAYQTGGHFTEVE